MLHYVRQGIDLILDTDASQHAIGVVLIQLNEQGKVVHLAFASKMLCLTWQWYLTVKQELYAILYIMHISRVTPMVLGKPSGWIIQHRGGSSCGLLFKHGGKIKY